MNSCVEQALKRLAPKLSSCRRDIHQHPESGWTEFRTASLAIRHLESLGYAITMGADAVKRESMMGVPAPDVLKAHQERAVAQGADPKLVAMMDGGLTGFWADLDCGEGPCLALRFDMDCNDVTETADPDHRAVRDGFRSVNAGAMHACGHDGHVAVGLALAEVVASCKETLCGTIRFIFQPAEEGVRGAMPMADAGAVDGVDTILGFHIGFQASRPGIVICGTQNFLATSKANIFFKGVPAHAGAAPEEGRNALLAACTATLNMHAIPRSGKGDTRITVGRLWGGQGRNVIPPDATLVMETRGVTSELDAYMFGEVKRIAKAAADMWGCSCNIVMQGGTRSGESSADLAGMLAASAREMGCFDTVVEQQNFGASEDFSHFMSIVQQRGGKGAYVQVGTTLTAGHHNDHFDFDEAVLPRALELLARAVWRLNGK